MMLALKIILLVTLMFVIYQDLSTRTIHVVLPIAIFVMGLLINSYVSHLHVSTVLSNILFILINIGGLMLYTTLKAQKINNPINKTLGLGDILFFIAITPLFNFKTFILFFVLGLMFSLITHGFSNIFKRIQTIPLAGYLALFLILNMASHFAINKSFLF